MIWVSLMYLNEKSSAEWAMGYRFMSASPLYPLAQFAMIRSRQGDNHGAGG
jgi:hypothetical protein